MSDAAAILATRCGPIDGVALPKGEGLAVTLAPHAARFIYRGAPEHVAAFGPTAPEKLCASTSGTRAALWLGPDEFLLIAPGEEAGAIEASLKSALPAETTSLVDISHRQIGLTLEGRLAARCLSAGCPLDFRLSAFPVGMATRTIFLKAEIVLWREAENRFHVEIWRSFSPYLVGHLAEAFAGTNGL